MSDFLRPIAAMLGIVGLAAAISVSSNGTAFAQAKQQQMAPPQKQAPPPATPPQAAPAPELKQIALTDKQIESVLAAQKDMDAVTDKIPDNAPPDPKIDAKLDDVAKKYGFANYPDYNTVIDNISLVLGGIDPATKKYVGTETVIKAQIAQVTADKKMPAKDKKEALADLNEALKQPQPAVQNKGNIDLVLKYYDKLNEVERLSKPIYEKADRNEPLTEDDKIKLKEALVIFKALHEFRPTAFTLPFALGKGHQILGDDEMALQYFRQTEAQLLGSPGALEKATLAEARYLSVDSLIRLGETEAALEAAKLAVDFNGRSANYYVALASAQLQLKRRPEAKKSLESALRIDPHNARAIRLGQLLLADNDN